MIAVGLLCTVLALFAISTQLSTVSEEDKKQNAEQTFIASPPSNAFCTRALKGHRPFVCAHGGETSVHQPNTAAAYSAALLYTDCIEMDASLTLDHQLVSMHDRDLQQLLQQPSAKVEHYTLQQLQSDEWPESQRVMTVQQALAAAVPHAEQLIIDVKADAADKVLRLSNGSSVSQHAYIAEQLLQLLAAHEDCSSSCLVWGKADKVIKQVLQRAPRQLAGYVVLREKTASRNKENSQYSDPLRRGLQEAKVVAVHHDLLDTQLVSTLRSGGKSAYAWTADSPTELQRLLDLGIDGIVTNRPALLSEAIDQRMRKCSATAQQRS
uniref:glycerophosphodiester phosphodiesterase n=1 Tax=Tetradesmus obliquus TaxID=3088 RepID=A0A383VZL3_TETOB|eukprot:jgi/Sobl393_1/13300/SZX70661.1